MGACATSPTLSSVTTAPTIVAPRRSTPNTAVRGMRWMITARSSTAVLGAVLVTGYLGGAVCTHVRSGDGAFSIVFAIVFGALVWLGLYLRDGRVAAIITRPA